MRIIYTHHARRRMAQREVSEAEVVETLETPGDILQGDEREDIAVKQFGAHEIRVVYEEIGRESVIIYTVMRGKSRGSRV